MSSFLSGSMIKGPIFSIDVIFCIKDAIVDVEVIIIRVEKNGNWFVLVPRDEIKMTAASKFINFEDTPDGIVQAYDWIFR